MTVKRLATIFMLISMTLLSACGEAKQFAVTGVIDHPHSMIFPEGTVMTIELVDITKEGSPGKTIAQNVVKDQQLIIPMPFVVTYDPGKINEEHHYSIRVTIEDGEGKWTYGNEQEVPVITQGNPRVHIDVMVDLVKG